MSLLARRALAGLATAAAVLALPAVASAAISPTLTLTQPSGTTGGSNPATVVFDAAFNPTAGDSVKDVTFALAPGLLANANINGGACLIATSPSAPCQVGTGTVTAGGVGVPVTEYLVAAPSGSGGAGGLDVVNNATQAPLATGVASVTPTGLDVAFKNLSPGISTMSFTLTDLRLPTSCPATPANVTITADSQQSASSTNASAPLNVTGCSGLPYNPTVSATETKDAKDTGATLVFTVTQQANEAATKSISLKLPSGLGINLGADVTCLLGTGGGCNVGSASATSPLVPNVALANGVVVLGGSASNPTITISFPAPFALTLVGNVSVANGTITFNNVPDLTLTSLNLTITGPNGKKAFTTKCQASTTTGTFTGWGGKAQSVTGAVKLVNCGPTATGALSGLASGHPGLKVTATHGAANISSVSIGLPGGLRFSRAGIVTSKTCTTKGGKKKCTTTTLTKGLGISGATAKSVALKGGQLLITFKKAASKVTIRLSGPVLAESGSLQTKVKKHKVKSLTVTLKFTDAKHATTSVRLKLKAH